MTHTSVQKYCSWVQDQTYIETNFVNSGFTSASERPEPRKIKINPDYVLDLMENDKYSEDNLLWKLDKCVNSRFQETKIEIDRDMNVEYSYTLYPPTCDLKNHSLMYDEVNEEFYCPICES